MLKNFPEGSDLTLINTLYHYPKKVNGKYTKGSIDIIYKDNMTGNKYLETIDDPEYRYYMVNPEHSVDYNRYFAKREHVEEIITPYSELEKDIAKRLGMTDVYFDNIKSGNRRDNRAFHKHKDVFSSDNNIEDHIRIIFSERYSNNVIIPTKAYFDIEVDAVDIAGEFVAHGEKPINAVTIINDSNNTIYTLLLRKESNPLIAEFEKSLDAKFFEDLKLFVQREVGGWKNEIRFGLAEMKYEIMFYDEDDEINLIIDTFKIFNTFNPDFILAWNMGVFDITYIIERIKVLGYTPESIMCNPIFKDNKTVYYFVDAIDHIKGGMKKFEQRGDYGKISSLSVYMDQLVQFASRRKGQSTFPNMKLDTIGEMITGVKKLDYHHLCNSIVKLPYVDYKTFVIYNIMDTIVQKCIEVKTGDIDYVFAKSTMNATRYPKIHRQTAYIINRSNSVFGESDYVIGNNTNGGNIKEGFPGAHVADPKMVNNYAKKYIAGRPVLIFDNADDYDFKALYPSILEEFNIAPNTQIGRILLSEQIHKDENKYDRDRFSREGKFLEDMHSKNYLEVGARWCNMADYSQLYDDVIDYFKTVEPSVNMINDCNKINGNPYLFRDLQGFDNNPKLFNKIEESKVKLFKKSYKQMPEELREIYKNIKVEEIVYHGTKTKDE